jgi:glucose-6-phosphate isomerase
MLFDMEDVIFDKKWLSEQKKNFPLYEMQREIKKVGDIRYDITKIYGKMLGAEFNKTFGHYHPNGFPEIYEVMKGKAIFLLQKPVRIPSKKIADVVAIFAKKRDQIVIPPRYGHVTINPTNKLLVIANLVSCRFSSIYEPYRKFQGACYYYTKKGWVKNPNYIAPKLRRKKAKKVFKEKLEKLLENDLETIEWLNTPKKFPNLLI